MHSSSPHLPSVIPAPHPIRAACPQWVSLGEWRWSPGSVEGGLVLGAAEPGCSGEGLKLLYALVLVICVMLQQEQPGYLAVMCY